MKDLILRERLMSITSTLFKQGLDAYHSGNWDAARQVFEQLLEADPYQIEALLNLGNVHFRQNHFPQAEEAWQKAIQIDPTIQNAYLNLGKLYYSQQQYDKALSYWTIYTALAPTKAQVYLNMGLAHEANRHLHSAYNCYQRYLVLQVKGVEPLFLRRRMAEAQRIAGHNLKQAEKYRQSGKLEHASQAYQACAEIYPLYAKAYRHYAEVLYKLKDVENACVWYEAAHQLEPNHTHTLMNLGICYDRLERPFEALWAYTVVQQQEGTGTYYKIKQRLETLWQTHGPALLDKTLRQAHLAMAQHHDEEVQRTASRMKTVCSVWAPEKKTGVTDVLQALADRQDPKTQAGKMAYAMAEDCRAAGQYEKALLLYDRYRGLLPQGEHVVAVKDIQEQLRKTVAAIIHSMVDSSELLLESAQKQS
jgi:tetratricopeptide (TPR) repeat protein